VSFLVFHHSKLFCMMMCSLGGFFMNHLFMATFSWYLHPAVFHCLPHTVCLPNVSSRSSKTSKHHRQQVAQTHSMLVSSFLLHHAQSKYCWNVTLPFICLMDCNTTNHSYVHS
jgi:hypothetical protein